MKKVLYLLAAVCLLGARGCPSNRRPSTTAVLIVESASARDLSPSKTAVSLRADNEIALAKVMAHIHNRQFQSEVADSVGVSPDTVGAVVLQRVPDTRLVKVRAALADPEQAAKVINAVARRLAEDFRNSADVKLHVLNYAMAPEAAREETAK